MATYGRRRFGPAVVGWGESLHPLRRIAPLTGANRSTQTPQDEAFGFAARTEPWAVNLRTHAPTSLQNVMAAFSSYPWLALRATRWKGYASGPRVGACRRIGEACIRGW